MSSIYQRFCRTELLGTPPPPQSKDAVQTVEESSNELESEEDELNAFEKCKVILQQLTVVD